VSVVVTRMTPESRRSCGQLALEVRYSVLDVARFRDEFFAASGQHVASWQPLEEPQAKPLLKGANAPQTVVWFTPRLRAAPASDPALATAST
jgi:hypothetical protein